MTKIFYSLISLIVFVIYCEYNWLQCWTNLTVFIRITIKNNLSFITDVNCDISNKCDLPLKHYEELNCDPLIKDGKSCPVRYKCPDLSERGTNKCYINKKVFNRGDNIPQTDIRNPCQPACYCNK